MTALMPPVPRRPRAARRDASRQVHGGASVPDVGVPLFGVDLDDLESWLDAHPAVRDEVFDLVRLATPAGESDGHGTGPHAVCTVLVSVVMALESIDELREQLITSAADVLANNAMAVVRERVSGDAADALKPLIVAVLEHVLDAAVPELLLVDPEVLMALRLAAFVACPDPGDHADVVERCVRPLVTTIIDDSDLE